MRTVYRSVRKSFRIGSDRKACRFFKVFLVIFGPHNVIPVLIDYAKMCGFFADAYAEQILNGFFIYNQQQRSEIFVGKFIGNRSDIRNVIFVGVQGEIHNSVAFMNKPAVPRLAQLSIPFAFFEHFRPHRNGTDLIRLIVIAARIYEHNRKNIFGGKQHV